MDTVYKLLEALLFAVLGGLFYWWQMRQIRRDRARSAAEHHDREGEKR